MKTIDPRLDKIRQCLDDATPQMHPGDYADTLANIVHYALQEAERLARHTGNNRPLLGIIGEITTIASLHLPDTTSLN